MARSGYGGRILRMAWKLALLAAIAGGVVYYLRFPAETAEVAAVACCAGGKVTERVESAR
jgi:hypothetical protein